ncbi:histidine kinase [Desulfovibrio sp. OttesenSCG-928-I05]|nr:histidine kinase [Desulfovibrio sp. OttesenSCG-928-I05]
MPKRRLSALRWYFVVFFSCSFILYAVTPALVLHYIIGTFNLLILYVNIQADEVKQKELELLESRTAVMLSQIGPHFLLNSLTSIGQLCKIDPPRAQQAITHFSYYLRGNMESLTCKHSVPLAEEMEHVKHYLWLESLRFGDALRTVFAIQVLNFHVPPLILQPIVENAVRHGVTKKKGGGTVTIKTGETERSWRITVSDDGAGFDPDVVATDGRRHIGIENVRSRLAAICGGSLRIASTPGEGTVAVIEIPKQGTGELFWLPETGRQPGYSG